VDTSFRFADLEQLESPHLLPGAVKYGDVDALIALAKPERIIVFGNTELVSSTVSMRRGKSKIQILNSREKGAMWDEAAARLIE